MNRTHIIFKCTSSYLWYMLSIEDTSCIVFIRSFLLIQNYSFLIINLNKGSIKSIHSTYKFVYLSFRSKYFPTVENTTSGLVSVSLFHHLIKPSCILLPSLSTWIKAALNQFTQSKICLPISFRFEYLPTAENSMTYVVPKAIMVHHRRVKSALSFSF